MRHFTPPQSPFGKALHRFLFSNRQMALLPSYGWNDGGCWTLAQALVAWSQGQLTLAGAWSNRTAPYVTHVVATAGSFVLDADGVFTEKQLIEKLAVWESSPGCWVAPLTTEHLLRQANIEYLPEVSALLAARLHRRFGAYTHKLIPESLWHAESPDVSIDYTL